MLTGLQHPNLISVLAFGIDSGGTGAPYMVMELLEGRTLQSLIEERGPLDARWTCERLIEVCSALATVHAQGIVHRDIKPSNIMIVENAAGEATAKLVDFGIAKWRESAEGRGALTRTGDVIGSLAYMSPERLRGKEADFRSDVFSIGCVLYEMLYASPAFDAERTADLAVRLDAVMPPFPPAVPVHRDLQNVIRKCLQENPDCRYQTVEALEQDIDSFLTTGTVRGSIPRDASGRRPRKRLRGLIALACVLEVFLLAIIARIGPAYVETNALGAFASLVPDSWADLKRTLHQRRWELSMVPGSDGIDNVSSASESAEYLVKTARNSDEARAVLERHCAFLKYKKDYEWLEEWADRYKDVAERANDKFACGRALLYKTEACWNRDLFSKAELPSIHSSDALANYNSETNGKHGLAIAPLLMRAGELRAGCARKQRNAPQLRAGLRSQLEAAEIYLQCGKVESATTAAERLSRETAEESLPDLQMQAQFLAGCCYERSGRPEEAIEAFLEALRVCPDRTSSSVIAYQAFSELLKLSWEAGIPEKATEGRRLVEEKDLPDMRDQLDLRWTDHLINLGQWADATAVARQAIRRSGDRVGSPTLVLLGRALMELGQYDEAERAFDRGRRLARDRDESIAVDVFSGVLDVRIGHYVDGSRKLKSILDEITAMHDVGAPNLGRLQYGLQAAYHCSIALSQQRRFDEASELLIRHMTLMATDPVAVRDCKVCLGEVYLDAGKRQEAYRCFKQALPSAGENSPRAQHLKRYCLASLAKISETLGRPEEARRYRQELERVSSGK